MSELDVGKINISHSPRAKQVMYINMTIGIFEQKIYKMLRNRGGHEKHICISCVLYFDEDCCFILRFISPRGIPENCNYVFDLIVD